MGGCPRLRGKGRHVDVDREVGHGLFPSRGFFVFLHAFFCTLHQPSTPLFEPVTPGFLIPVLIPLYVAWFFFMLRFYLMPWLLGYTVMGMLSFPLESELAGLIYRTLSPQ